MSAQQQQAQPEACPHCQQSKTGLGHAFDCWFAFEREIAERRPQITRLTAEADGATIGSTLDFIMEIQEIFGVWNERIRQLESTNFTKRDALVRIRLERTLAFVDKQLERRNATGDHPHLRIVGAA